MLTLFLVIALRSCVHDLPETTLPMLEGKYWPAYTRQGLHSHVLKICVSPTRYRVDEFRRKALRGGPVYPNKFEEKYKNSIKSIVRGFEERMKKLEENR